MQKNAAIMVRSVDNAGSAVSGGASHLGADPWLPHTVFNGVMTIKLSFQSNAF